MLTFDGSRLRRSFPVLALGVPLGVLNDRWDNRRTLIWSSTAQAALMSGLAVSVFMGVTPIALLYAVGFTLTVLTMLGDTARQALVPRIIAVEHLEMGDSRLYIAEATTTQFAGPPLGSLLFAFQQAIPFALDAGSFAAGAIALAKTSAPDRETTGKIKGKRRKGSFARETMEGLRWIRGQRLIQYTIAGNMATNLGSEMLFAVFPLFTLELLHLPKAAYGLLFLAYAVGAILGGWLAPRLRWFLGDGPAVIFSILIFGAPLAGMCLWLNAWLAGVMMVLSGIGEGVWNVLVMSLRQTLVPAELRGRVLSVLRMFGWGSMPVGAVLGGVAASGLGLRWPGLIGGGAIVIAGAALAPFLRTRAIREARAVT